MEWESPAIILSARTFGEADLIVSALTELHGRHAGLARGGVGRRQVALWQAGNAVALRWTGRVADQLGTFGAELVHAAGALVLDDARGLAVLNAACAVADGALPEREPHPRLFSGLLRVLASVSEPDAAIEAMILWEAALLADLGFGLDLSRCAVTGVAAGLAYVSPRSGRAVSAEAAGAWRDRLLRLPPFLCGNAPPTPDDLQDGLRLTGHFLARDVFGAHNRPLPPAREGIWK